MAREEIAISARIARRAAMPAMPGMNVVRGCFGVMGVRAVDRLGGMAVVRGVGVACVAVRCRFGRRR